MLRTQEPLTFIFSSLKASNRFHETFFGTGLPKEHGSMAKISEIEIGVSLRTCSF